MSKIRAILIGLSFSIPLFLGTACGDDWNTEENSSKPRASGDIGEIILVMDSALFQGPVGDAVRDVFEDDIQGLVRQEKIFNIRRVDPESMNRVLKRAPNIVYVTTFDGTTPGSRIINRQFNQTSKEMAEKDPKLFMLRIENEFARGQEVLYLFGNNEEQLIQNLRANKNKLQNFYVVRERNRLGEGILRRTNSAVKVKGKEKFGIEINVPASYQFVQEDENFLWLRQPTPTTDRADISLFFYQTDYVSEEQVFPENIIALRNEITKSRIFGDPANRNSYTEIQEQAPPHFRNIDINGHYGIEVRGQWRTHNLSMGGSFLSYVVVDEANGKLYYMDGFIYYPNEEHRAALREIETVLLATEFPSSSDEAKAVDTTQSD